MTTIIMDCSAQERPLVLSDSFRFDLLLNQLNFSRQAFNCLYLREPLLSHLIGRPLHLLDARRKATDLSFQITYSLPFFNALLACSIAAQGFGTSKNKASALMSISFTANPFPTTSRHVEVTFFSPRSLKNCLVISARCWLNSNVQRWPDSLMISAMAQESEPEPVPASITTDPGTKFSLKRMAELSIAYKICVFLAKVQVISVDLGFSALKNLPGLLCASILVAQGQLMKFKCRKAAPSEVCILLPAINCINFGWSSFSNTTPYSLSFTLSSTSTFAYPYIMFAKNKRNMCKSIKRTRSY